uniref:Uncharacterized protein n=1 Tax=Theropithecus gelada TaxID=9565 RepID=A0A8D2FX38_THEGE
QAWWCTPVIPATQESKLLGRLRQENHLNPGGGGCSESRSHHCTPVWATERDCLGEKRKKRKKEIRGGYKDEGLERETEKWDPE